MAKESARLDVPTRQVWKEGANTNCLAARLGWDSVDDYGYSEIFGSPEENCAVEGEQKGAKTNVL